MDGKYSVATVLLVDDEEPVLRLVSAALRNDGYNVITACDAATALHLSRGQLTLNILITDLDMGKGRMNGIELAGRVKDEHPDVDILVISGAADVRELVREHNLPFLAKPFTAASLIYSLKQLRQKTSPMASSASV
jgi:DNA-binding NtrC family response regulator